MKPPAALATGMRAPALIALVVAPLVVAIIALLLFQEFEQGLAAQRAIQRSYQTQTDVQRLFSLLQDAETGQRGYAITGQKTFLGPYEHARANLPGAFAQVGREFASDAAQAARLRRVEDIAAAKVAEMERVIQARDTRGMTAASAVVASQRGKILMDRIRAVIRQIETSEQSALKLRLHESGVRTARTEQSIVALFVFLAAAIVFAAWLVWRNARQRETLVKELHRLATRQQAIFSSAIDAIVLLNPSGSIESINRSGERIFGRASASLARRDVELLLELPPERDGNFLQRLGVTRADLERGVLKELTGRRADGATFPVDLALGAMDLPDGLHIVAVIRDISERKRAERLKDEFVSTVSHELRTPLTSIAGSLGLLSGGAVGELPDRAARLIGIAHSNCQRLVRLINDILDIEKIESGKLKFETQPLRLADVADRAAEGLRGYADELGVRIVVDSADDPVVRGDPDRLIQVITNLASNAVKFSPPGGLVEIRVRQDQHTARLSVSDSGPGIPQEFRARVFSKFAQADSSDARQKGGTGLGLAIAKEIVDRHGGRLWFESARGEGTTFHVDLPLDHKPTRVAPTTDHERLLICEDDVDAAAIIRETLEGAGFGVDVVTSLGDARAAIRGHNAYAAVLMDLQLPDGDGISLIRELRADPDTRDLPIVVVSAYIDRGREEAGSLALNVVDWMEKPVDVDRLRRVVQSALSRAAVQSPVILHVDDDHDILQVTAATLAGVGEVVSVSSLSSARKMLRQRRPSVVILDLGLADGSGLDLLPELKDASGAPIPVVIFSAQDVEGRVLRKVDIALTKSRTSLAQLARTVRHLVRSSEFGDA